MSNAPSENWIGHSILHQSGRFTFKSASWTLSRAFISPIRYKYGSDYWVKHFRKFLRHWPEPHEFYWLDLYEEVASAASCAGTIRASYPRVGGTEWWPEWDPMHFESLHGDPTLGHAIVVVNVAARDETSPAVHEILGQLGLGFDAAQAPPGPIDGDAVVFRVPHERLAEVVVGLESYGFTDVRAYEGHPMP